MSKLFNMLASWNRWRQVVGGVESFAPSIDAPCAINRKDGVGGEEADSGLFRFAPAVLPDSNGVMRRHDGIAYFTPKMRRFRMHAQEESGATGNTIFGEDFLDINESGIWAVASSPETGEALETDCVPHCERLAYMARLGSPYANPLDVKGWFRGGGNQENECPLQGTKMMYGRLWGQGICDSLRVKTMTPQNTQENRMPLPQGDVWLTEEVPLSSGLALIDSNETQPPIFRPYGGIYPPYGDDCYVDSETWGGWCPSLLDRPGDYIPSSKDEQIKLKGFDLRRGYHLDGYGRRIYDEDWIETPESLAGAYDLVLDGSSLALSWDWRMFYAFVSRNYHAQFRGYGAWKRTWNKMYWDIGDKFDTPSNIDMQELMDYIVEYAWGGTNPLIAPGTVFDVRIQAMVYSFKYPADRSNNISGFLGKVLWDKMGYGAGGHVYMWSHTNLEVFIRQAMPLTA